MATTCDECKKEIDDEVFESEERQLCEECFECDEKAHTFTCDVCEWKHDERYNYAGCCNDGDCKFGREKMCYDCCKVDEETGIPVCLDCIKAKTKKIRTIRVPLCRLSE